MLIMKRSDTYDRRLYRRKSGGGRSSGSSKGGSRGSTSSLSSGGGKIKSGKSATKSSTSITKTGGTSRHGVGSGIGGGSSTGRLAGGATRSQSYGNRDYGSGGYPCPFKCLSSYHGRGIMMTAAFPSSSQNTTFRVVADNTTLSTLLVNIVANCSSDIFSPSTITPTTFNDSLVSPKPEQTVQYYRTVALTLDGYNNTGALEADGTPDTPLPTNIDTSLLNCLNYTIGEAVPLIGSASLQWTSPSIGVISFIWVLWCLSSIF